MEAHSWFFKVTSYVGMGMGLGMRLACTVPQCWQARIHRRVQLHVCTLNLQALYLHRNSILPAVAQNGPTIVYTVSELIVYSKLVCALVRCEISRADSERELT